MSTAATPTVFSSKVKAELSQTLLNLGRGVRNVENAKAACRRMDQMREDNRQLFGEQNIAVELIREARKRS